MLRLTASGSLASKASSPRSSRKSSATPDSVGESQSSGRPMLFGYTSSGKYLVCVYEMVDQDTILPVTAYEVNS